MGLARDVPGEKLYVAHADRFLLRNSRGESCRCFRSSFTDEGYAIGLARSRSGDIGGPWGQISAADLSARTEGTA